MDYVNRMSLWEFERAWVMMHLVNQASSKDGVEDMKMSMTADQLDAVDAGETHVEIDPSAMSPEELQAWAEKWYADFYNQT